MKYLKLGLTFLFGAFMIMGGVAHFRTPDMYYAFIPDFLPESIINYAVGSHKAALIRLPVQFLFIAWAWYIKRDRSTI